MTEVPKPLDAALDLFVYAPVGLALTAAEELPKLAAKGRSRVNTQLMMARVVGQFAVTRGRQEIEKRFAPPVPGSSPGSSSGSSSPGSSSSSPSGSGLSEDPEAQPPVTFDEMTAANGSGPGLPGADRVEGGDDVSVSTAGDLATVTELPVHRRSAGQRASESSGAGSGSGSRSGSGSGARSGSGSGSGSRSGSGSGSPSGATGTSESAAPAAEELAIPGYDSLSASQVVQRLAGLSGQELVAVGAYERAHRGRRTILNRIDQLQGQ